MGEAGKREPKRRQGSVQVVQRSFKDLASRAEMSRSLKLVIGQPRPPGNREDRENLQAGTSGLDQSCSSWTRPTCLSCLLSTALRWTCERQWRVNWSGHMTSRYLQEGFEEALTCPDDPDRSSLQHLWVGAPPRRTSRQVVLMLMNAHATFLMLVFFRFDLF